MQFGVCIPHYGTLLDGPAVRDVAQAAEALGFDSIWATDHVVVPAGLDIIYREDMLECLTVLAYAAACTQRIRVGTSVVILPYRNPILVAKMVATVDVLSGGRAVFGAAAGWMEGEFAALGAPYHERGRYTNEALSIIRELWTNENPRLEGRYYQFRDIVFSPRPLQKPHPPIWIGGNSPAAMQRALKFGDAWHVTGARPENASEIAGRLREGAKAKGREQTPALTARVTVDLDGGDGRSVVQGTPEAAAAAFRSYAQAGFSHLVLSLAASGAQATVAMMERLARDVIPQA